LSISSSRVVRVAVDMAAVVALVVSALAQDYPLPQELITP
jgi:hypothetical protein